jgi:hypothetical protein
MKVSKSKRNQAKIKKILKQRGYKSGKAPKSKVIHHIKPKAKKGRDTSKNIRVIAEGKHKRIHRNRRKRGEI